jgi:hypothetical protein
MRHRAVRAGLLVLVICALSALWAAAAAAQPGTGPRETVDQSFTTTRPSSPTGVSYTGGYHAAGNPKGNPPYMRRMVFYPPRGMRYDTSVPERCSASDLELEVRGPAACPAGSRLGGGTVEGLFYEPIGHAFVFDHYKHTVDVMNNANEQIVLVKSEGFTVVRGRNRPDGSIEYTPPTCFPAPPTGKCADDYVLQLRSSTFLPPYKTTSGGRLRSYATTPAKCPAQGYWRTTIRFWWADGSVDTVATQQPCRPARKS